ncbi:hypothetical protein HK100_010185, partial [Physocladia obscura]
MSAPMMGRNVFEAKLREFAEKSEADNPSKSAERITSFFSPSNGVYRDATFYPPVGPLELLNELNRNLTLDNAVCSAAIHAVVRTKVPFSIIPMLLERLEANGATVTPEILCFTAEAFAAARNLEGIEYVMRALRETNIKITRKDDCSFNSKTLKRERTEGQFREVWKRVWMASLTAASRVGNVEAVEIAMRGFYAVCSQKKSATMNKIAGINVDSIGSEDRSMIMRAIDKLLAAQARKRDHYGVKKILAIMRDQDAEPSTTTLRILYMKGLEEKVNEVMGNNWLMEVISKPKQ